MKKLILLAAMGLAVSTFAQAAYKDGVYTGVGQGNASDIHVQVTVKNGKIADLKVIKNGETPMLVASAEKRIKRELVKKQKPVDKAQVCSGATNSSKGILQAVKKALEKAK